MSLRPLLASSTRIISRPVTVLQKCLYSGGERGSGAGKGGGAGGTIRESGGKMGEMGAAKEDEYFYKKQKEQLASLKEHSHTEIAFHEEQIKQHQDAIARHQKLLKESEQGNS
uniref:ATP synthase F1 subunit epsilon n=1 Tax=Cacopsylla melanoneura TaxID=428564 RepID=A0A8D9BK63_9HEMI